MKYSLGGHELVDTLPPITRNQTRKRDMGVESILKEARSGSLEDRKVVRSTLKVAPDRPHKKVARSSRAASTDSLLP